MARVDSEVLALHPRVLHRTFVTLMHFTDGEAADLVAVVHGLPPHHWTVEQIVAALALRRQKESRLSH